jgi:hypothetical protein
MTDETPKPEQSQNAADHVEGAMDAIAGIENELKAAVGGFVSAVRAEAEEFKGNLKQGEQRFVGRLRSMNSRFRNFIEGNDGPLIDDAKVIDETKALPKE